MRLYFNTSALRFAMQTERGQGDYAARRQRILGHLSVNELLGRMRRRSKSGRRGQPRR